MKLFLATMAGALVFAASQMVALADPKSVEATEHQAKADYKAAKKQAEADYKVAKDKCGALSGNDKDVCMKEAKAHYVHATEDAEAAMKSTKAGAEATEDKMAADYKVAKEKCDAMSGEARKACIADAKAQYKN